MHYSVTNTDFDYHPWRATGRAEVGYPPKRLKSPSIYIIHVTPALVFNYAFCVLLFNLVGHRFDSLLTISVCICGTFEFLFVNEECSFLEPVSPTKQRNFTFA